MKSGTVVPVVALVLLAAGLRISAIAPKPALEHDDAMTYVASSGRAYSEWTSLQGRWVRAAAWKALSTPLPGLGAAGIARHISDSGVVHPPLYFWLLHAWSLAFGTGLVAGPALNVLLACLTVLVLCRLGVVLFGEREPACFAAALWALSPGAVGVSPLVRPYELLALFGAMLALVVARYRRGERGTVPLFAAAAVGMLTHYEFAFLVAAAAVVLAARSAGGRGRAFRGLAALALGVVASLVLNPLFYRPFVSQAHAAKSAAGGFADRLLSADAPSIRLFDHSFFSPPWTERWSTPIALLSVLALVLLAAGALRAARRPGARALDPGGPVLAAAFFAAAFFGHWAAWVLGLLPLHASGMRYLSPSFPFLALLLVGSARGLGARNGRAVLVCLAGLELAGTGLLLRSLSLQRAWSVPEELATAERVLVDHTGTGVLPRVVALVPDSTPVYAQMQETLLKRPDSWRRELVRCRLAAWASIDLFYDGNDAGKTRRLEELIGEEADLDVPVSYPRIGGSVTSVTRRPDGGRP